MADKIAGIDVHKKVLMVVVIDARTPESKPERRRFATMPSESGFPHEASSIKHAHRRYGQNHISDLAKFTTSAFLLATCFS
jgi:hypothetical protein